MTEERLSRIFLELQKKGANNINLVTATQFLPTVIPALQHAKKMGLTIPIVYNTGGYEKVETLRLLEELVDIWLPDCKYRSAELAARYSRAADYPETVKTALAEMVRQTGAPLFDRRGMMKKGVITPASGASSSSPAIQAPLRSYNAIFRRTISEKSSRQP